jgi:hypothetical protein
VQAHSDETCHLTGKMQKKPCEQYCKLEFGTEKWKFGFFIYQFISKNLDKNPKAFSLYLPVKQGSYE